MKISTEHPPVTKIINRSAAQNKTTGAEKYTNKAVQILRWKERELAAWLLAVRERLLWLYYDMAT